MQFLLTQVFAAAAVRNPDTIPVLIVCLIGLVLVFAILFILIAIIKVEGGLFGSAEKKKQAQQKKEEPPKAPVAAVEPQASVASVPAPVVGAGIPPEVVAAIVASVDAMAGGNYVIRAISAPKKRRGAWGTAGVMQSTEPF